MKAAPAGGMDVGDMMTGPLKESGLPMGVAWSRGCVWKTKMHNIIVIEFKLNYEAFNVREERQSEFIISNRVSSIGT